MNDQQTTNEAACGGSALTTELGAEHYYADFSHKHNGWCVFKRKSELFSEFQAGAFSERAAAQSEAKRLNDLAPNA